jgi:hypothetical protein
MRKHLWLVLCAASTFFFCAAPVTMIKAPRRSLDGYANLEVLELQNDVVGQIDEAILYSIVEKATKGIADLDRFQKIVVPENVDMNDKKYAGIFVSLQEVEDEQPETAVLKTTLVKYDKGNAFLRFLFGFMAGSGKVTLELAVSDMNTGEEIMKAETTAQIAGSFSSERDVVIPLSLAIVKFVKEYFVKI